MARAIEIDTNVVERCGIRHVVEKSIPKRLRCHVAEKSISKRYFVGGIYLER